MEIRPSREDSAQILSFGLIVFFFGVLVLLLPPMRMDGHDLRGIFGSLGVPIALVWSIFLSDSWGRKHDPMVRVTLLFHGRVLIREGGTLTLEEGLLTFRSERLSFAIGNEDVGETTVSERRRIVFPVRTLPEETKLILDGLNARDTGIAWKVGPSVPSTLPIPKVMAVDGVCWDSRAAWRFVGVAALSGSVMSAAGLMRLDAPSLWWAIPAGTLLAPLIFTPAIYIRFKDRQRDIGYAEQAGFRPVPE